MTIVASLTAEELRVLACLIEKSYTTPDQYPLSTNALTAACNQKTSREPVVDYPTQLVDRTLQLLRDGGWVRMKRPAGSRAFKHFHVVDEKLGLDRPGQAVLAVLALRGPQSAGELRTRTERYHPFADPAEVDEVLDALAARSEPLVRNVGRAAGQSQDRWVQLLGSGPTEVGSAIGAGNDLASARPPASSPSTASSPAVAPPAPTPDPAAAVSPTGHTGEVAELRERVETLEARLAALERELGLDG